MSFSSNVNTRLRYLSDRQRVVPFEYASGVAIALAIGLALRWAYSVGFVAGFPQDDGIYVNIARLLRADVDLVHRYRTLLPDYPANPAEIYTFRIAFVYPLSWAFGFLGEGDTAALVVGIGAALLSVIVIAEIARTAMGPEAGVAAALLLALLPHDILLTTRVLSDGPLRLFVALACLFALRGLRSNSPIEFGAMGLALGFAYLTKLTGGALFGVFGLVLFIRCLKRRTLKPLLAYVGVFALVVGAETAWYWWRTGQLFLHYRIVHSAVLWKLEFEPVSHIDIGRYLRVVWEGEFFWYAPIVLGLSSVGHHAFAGFGVFGWLWLIGLVWATRERSPELKTLVLLAVGLYLFVELFPLDVRFADGRLQYSLVYRQWRFASLLTPAWVALGGGFLAWLTRKRPYAAIAVLVIVVASGWPSLRRNYEVSRGSQTDLRAAAEFIRSRPETTYTDRHALSTLHYYLGSPHEARHLQDISSLNDRLPATNDLVITGGRRGIEVLADVWESELPAWCRPLLEISSEPPPGWRVLMRIPGPTDGTRLHDLFILQRVT